MQSTNTYPKKAAPQLYPVDRDLKKTWYISYPNPAGGKALKKYGDLNNLSTHAERMKEADRLIRELLLILPAAAPAKNTNMLRDLTEFLEARCMGAKHKTFITYRTYVEEFARWYRLVWDRKDADMMGIRFQKYLMDKGKSPTTVNNYRNGLKTIFADLVKFGKYPINPFTLCRKLTERRKSKEWFKENQLQELKKEIEKTDTQLWLACRLQFYAFPRPNEIKNIKIGDINLEEKKIRISSYSGKYYKQEYIQLPDALLADLVPYMQLPDNFYLFSPRGRPGIQCYGRDTMSKKHKRILKQLGYPKGYTFYSWKNTGAVHMLNRGMSLLDISRLMRHKSLDYTKEYFKSMGFDERRADIQQFYPVL